jgi:hypothetical protein
MQTRKAIDLRPGDFVDLEGDKYADPDNANVTYEFEYQEVCEVTKETPQCVAVGFDGSLVGFPPDHLLKVRGD